MEGQQLKMFKVFNSNGVGDLINIFGDENIVEFERSNIVGIKYDFNNNKLKYIMQRVPFHMTQQLIITSRLFIEIIEKIGSKGYRINYKLNMDLPKEETNQLNEYIFNISKNHSYDKIRLYKNCITEELNRLEEEYDVEFESVGFNSDGQRIVFMNNGILFANQDSFLEAGEVLC
ncbi:hypothetical protein M3936_22505 [Sutcliffiella horikoshii]|uniref:hypothetical protein n=1 Tax=Sutcliffiella horikoshii TaxID=79883 RepID=UPI00203F410F|nr:hypothetical protein [Sutcliffiella horikoshii]MCM3620331.1 hypothetical protein [Sutcliffiella horikoshii]